MTSLLGLVIGKKSSNVTSCLMKLLDIIVCWIIINHLFSSPFYIFFIISVVTVKGASKIGKFACSDTGPLVEFYYMYTWNVDGMNTLAISLVNKILQVKCISHQIAWRKVPFSIKTKLPFSIKTKVPFQSKQKYPFQSNTYMPLCNFNRWCLSTKSKRDHQSQFGIRQGCTRWRYASWRNVKEPNVCRIPRDEWTLYLYSNYLHHRQGR